MLPSLRPHIPAIVAVLLATVALDIATKLWAAGLPPAVASNLVGDTSLRFTALESSGLANLGGAGRHVPFAIPIVLHLAATVLLLWMLSLTPARASGYVVALSLMLAGGAANLFEFIVRHSATDFINVRIDGHQFPIFNLADVAVSCGFFLLLVIRTRDGLREEGWRRMIFLRPFTLQSMLLPPSLREKHTKNATTAG